MVIGNEETETNVFIAAGVVKDGVAKTSAEGVVVGKLGTSVPFAVPSAFATSSVTALF